MNRFRSLIVLSVLLPAISLASATSLAQDATPGAALANCRVCPLLRTPETAMSNCVMRGGPARSAGTCAVRWFAMSCQPGS